MATTAPLLLPAPMCMENGGRVADDTEFPASGAALCEPRAQSDRLRRDEKEQRHRASVTTMAMSNLYSKISTKPMKRFQDNVTVKQTNAWMNAESPSNTSDSPPSVSPLSSSIILQREGTAVNQPLSAPASPLSSLSSPVIQLNLPSPGDCTQDPNWQATKPTVRERNAAMFNNHLMADIIFIVGSPGHTQTIPAHKYVLATGSSVFYAMFYGGLPENKRDIEVPDVEPAAFLALLRYMYCDEVQLEADTVLATLYVAKKYIVPHLARACVNYLETSLTAKNACLLLSQSRLFEEPNLMQRCWEVIDAQVSQTQRTLRDITLSDKNLDRALEDDSSLSSDSVNHVLSLHSCVHDSKFDNLRYRRACRSNGGLSDDSCESFKSGLSIVPHCLSLSENDCCTNVLAEEHLSLSLFRTRSEPYFPDNKLDQVEVTQNITYQDNLIEEYECGKINRNDVSRITTNINQIVS